MLPQVAVLVSCSASAPSSPEGTNTCGVWAVSWKEPGSFFWWLTENREAFPKADEVTGLRLCFCCGTMTSYLPGGVLLSSPCNCDLGVKTRPLSPWQIEAQRSASLGYTSVAPSCEACRLLTMLASAEDLPGFHIRFAGSSSIPWTPCLQLLS